MENNLSRKPAPLLRRLLIVLGRLLLFLVLSIVFILVMSLPLGELVTAEQADAMARGDMVNTPPWLLNLTYLVVTIGVLLALFLVRKMIGRQPMVSAGLGLRKWPKESGEGLILGAVMVTAGYLILLASGLASSEGWHFLPATLFGWLLLFLLQPFVEELLFRGYLMSLLTRYFNIWTALIVSSFLFAFVHSWNDNFSTLGFVNITLAGLLFGLLFLKTGQLWLATGMHAAWNFAQGVIFGFPTSGIRTYSITETTTSGPDWLSGGGFGFEGSALASLILVAAIWWYWGSIKNEQLSALVFSSDKPAINPRTADIPVDQQE